MPFDAKALLTDVKTLPWWGWGLAGGAVLAGVFYFRKANASAPAQKAQPEYQAPDGLAMTDLAGMPVGYYDWSAANSSSTPSGYDPSQYPPSGSPPADTAAPAPISGPVLPPRGVNPPTTPTPVLPPRGVNPPTTTPTPSPTSNPAPSVYYHEVHAWPAWDSTLSGVAGHYGMSWQQLYSFGNDKQIIDSTAHQHGHYSQEYNWLFPGENLEVPRAG